MKLIQTQTLASPAAAIVFTGIPQTMTDLLLLVSCRFAATDLGTWSELVLYPNSSGSNTKTNQQLIGNGASASELNFLAPYVRVGFPNGGTSTANTFTNIQIWIPNYTSNSIKTYMSDGITENNATSSVISTIATTDTTTTPITSLNLQIGRDLSVGTVMSLYGITKGSIPGITVI